MKFDQNFCHLQAGSILLKFSVYRCGFKTGFPQAPAPSSAVPCCHHRDAGNSDVQVPISDEHNSCSNELRFNSSIFKISMYFHVEDEDSFLYIQTLFLNELELNSIRPKA